MLIIKSLALVLACGLMVNAQYRQLLLPHGQTLYTFNREHFYYRTAFGHLNMTQNLLFDTGASQSWVVSVKCQEPRCLDHARYSHRLSPTHHAVGINQEVNYGSLGVIRGELYRDRLYLTNIIVNDVTFLAAENLPDEEVLPRGLDGIIGVDLATFRHNATYKNPIQLMVEQSTIIPRTSFTLYTSRANGEYKQVLVFGSYLAHRPILFFPVTHPDRWQFHMEEITVREVNGHELVGVCQGGCEVILSSGMPVILGPSDEVVRMNEQIGATRSEDGRFLLPSCDFTNLPNLVFKTLAREFVLTPEEYAVQIGENPDICLSGIFEGSESAWVLGQNFLSSYFIIFDYTDKRVGFA